MFMANKHAHKLYFLLSLLMLFLVFNLMVAVLTGVNFVDLGLSDHAENLLVTFFSFVFVVLIVYDLVTL